MANIEEKPLTGRYFARITEATQADGEQSLSPAQGVKIDKWQLQVCVSETPTAGDLAVAIYSPGASEPVVIDNIDFTQCPVLKTYDYLFDRITFTPSSFDSDKTYSLVLNGKQD
jgi:hypothetical protein